MTMVAELVDAVVGGDTHKDTHALEMLSPVGVTLARLSIHNDEDGFTEAVAWIAEQAAGARVLVGLEGTPLLWRRAGSGVDPSRAEGGRGGATQTRAAPRSG
jgi:hypothetical protein